jgi:hypothetical protein
MAAGIQPPTIWINGYPWQPVYGTTAQKTYPSWHVALCNGDPAECARWAFSGPPFKSTPQQQKGDSQTSKEGKRLLSVLIRQYGYRPHKRTEAA